MTTLYRVLTGYRVGATQRWHKPGDKVRLLPCEAQYALSRGWLVVEEEQPISTENSTQPAKKAAVKTKGAKPDASE